MLKLYDSAVSGNCYKVRLLLSHLGIPYEKVEIDVINRGSRPEEITRKNPVGKVPVLELEDGRCLAESNAILFHLARGTDYLPDDPYQQAQVLGWLFFEQNNHEPNIAVARYWVTILGKPDDYRQELKIRHKGGYAALSVMERHLGRHPFFVGGRYSITDIALYAYTHVADEGDFDLGPYRAVNDWIERVRSQPGHVELLEPSSPRCG